MTNPPQDFAHQMAVEVYGSFIEKCVKTHVVTDLVGSEPHTNTADKIDIRPVRLVNISGKGGWSDDRQLRESWKQNDNISLLDHLLSVVRGALMLWLADQKKSLSIQTDIEEIQQLAYALVCIAFLHDIDKDLNLRRGQRISEEQVAERMCRYGIDDYLVEHYRSISPAAMLNYIEEVEGTQSARSPTAIDFDRRLAHVCKYIELADKLEGIFTSRKSDSGVNGVIASLGNLNHWPILQDEGLRDWKKIEIHDHLHVLLLDRFQKALSCACMEVTNQLPLIETVHDGQLLSVIPKKHANAIEERALILFLDQLPYKLRFSVNNRLACEFVGGTASWETSKKLMQHTYDWQQRNFASLLSLPKEFASQWKHKIDELFEVAGMVSSWRDGEGATVKPAFDYPGGDSYGLSMEPTHALVFLVIVLNHKDTNRKNSALDANAREKQLCELLAGTNRKLPQPLIDALDKDGRTRRIVVALWTIAEVWQLADTDLDGAEDLLNRIIGRNGLVGQWLEGNEHYPGIAEQVKDEASDFNKALIRRFHANLQKDSIQPFDSGPLDKRCILCNEPVAAIRKVSKASMAHGIKISAFSGRDRRNDHLASPSGDTHLCPTCLAESQLRQNAHKEYKGTSKLPPFISSPTTTGLFGGLVFQRNSVEVFIGLNDFNRRDVNNGIVYEGLDCQTRRIRIASLEELPNKDEKLVNWLHKVLITIQRTGRPIHIFCGLPRRHPAIFFFDSLPAWLEQLLGGNSLRIEQLDEAISNLKFFKLLSDKPGLGINWAKQLADGKQSVRIGALCVAWAQAVDRFGSADSDYSWRQIKTETQNKILSILEKNGGVIMNLKDNPDPLIQLAWLATRIQKRVNLSDSANKQILCWKIALDFYRDANGSLSNEQSALILGIAGTLEEALSRKNDAAARKHREGESLGEACITFAEHFAKNVWTKVFKSKEPTSQDQRRAAAIYRFALIEAYRQRGNAESGGDGINDNKSTE